MELTNRKQKILSSVIHNYIHSGEPVGSKVIADEIGVSSATIRNEMAELIDLGFLEQPHTSSGRIPSHKGYREYVDTILPESALGDEEKKFFESMMLSNAYDPERLLKAVARLLSVNTKFLSVVTTPSGSIAKVKAVQFVQISRRTAMLILMSSAGTVENRIFHCDFDLTSEILRLFFRVFNEKVTGMPVTEITIAFIQTMGASLGELSMLSGSALVALLEVAQKTIKTEMLLSGQMNLLFYPDFSLGTVRRIINFFDEKEEVLQLLTQKPGKPAVFIGQEIGKPELAETAIIISRYLVNRQDTGAIAVLGPVRMDYGKTIAALSYLSAQVGQMLTMLMHEDA